MPFESVKRLSNRYLAHLKYLILPVLFIIFTYQAFSYFPFSKAEFLKEKELKSKCSSYKPEFIADKWIIVTSINGPTGDLKKLSSIEGWKLLVVGDRKTPKDWKMDGVQFLSIDKQYEMGYEIVKLLPEGSYTRKMTGYLYAIQHGAKFIYETDDDNSPWPKLDFSAFYFGKDIMGMVVDAPAGAYNPLPHFGQSSMWPRGYPLDKISAKQPRKYYKVMMKTPPVQQGVVNGDPDVDAIYRLTRKHGDTRLNVTFDMNAPPIVLPKGALTSYNCQNTLFHYQAFWSLFLPPSRTFRVLDIWRSYWAQRLMWLVGQRLMYIPPSAFQFRSPHSFLSDFEEEVQLYHETGKLVDFLLKWSCSRSHFYECISELSHLMAAEKFWNDSDAKLVDAWLNDLQKICYIPPQLHKGADATHDTIPREVFYPIEQKTAVPNNKDTIVLPPQKDL